MTNYYDLCIAGKAQPSALGNLVGSVGEGGTLLGRVLENGGALIAKGAVFSVLKDAFLIALGSGIQQGQGAGLRDRGITQVRESGILVGVGAAAQIGGSILRTAGQNLESPETVCTISSYTQFFHDPAETKQKKDL